VTAPCPVQTPPPDPTAAGPDGRRVLARVGVADHEVTPEAPLPGSGWREHAYGGFGGGHPRFHPHADYRYPILRIRTISLGSAAVTAARGADLASLAVLSDRSCPLITMANGALMARRSRADLRWRLGPLRVPCSLVSCEYHGGWT
jgi:hypothetical protein